MNTKVSDLDDAIDPKLFWKAMGVRAAGVSIVAAEHGVGPRGFLALSPTHLCADPPTMMVSVDRTTDALSTIIAARRFSINYVGYDQHHQLAPFLPKSGVSGAERFKASHWSTGKSGAPILSASAGHIECVLEEEIYRHGTAILLGRVVAFEGGAGTTPMVSHGNKYLALYDPSSVGPGSAGHY
nr:flavin reductase family protein [uncultured Devosia sp.]